VEVIMKVNLIIIILKEKENLILNLGLFMKVNLKLIKEMEKELILIIKRI